MQHEMSYKQAIHLIQCGSFVDASQLLLTLPMGFESISLLGVLGQISIDWELAHPTSTLKTIV